MQEKDKTVITDKKSSSKDDEEILELSEEVEGSPDDAIVELTDLVQPASDEDEQIIDLSGTEVEKKQTKTLELTDTDRKAINNELNQEVEDKTREESGDLEELAGGPMSDKLTLDHVEDGEPEMIDIIDLRNGAAIQESDADTIGNDSEGLIGIEELAGGPLSDVLTEEEVASARPEMMDVIDLIEEAEQDKETHPDEKNTSESIEIEDLAHGPAGGSLTEEDVSDNQPEMMSIIELDEASESPDKGYNSDEEDTDHEESVDLVADDLRTEIEEQIQIETVETDILAVDETNPQSEQGLEKHTLDDAVELKYMDGATLAMEIRSDMEEKIVQEKTDTPNSEEQDILPELDVLDEDAEPDEDIDLSTPIINEAVQNESDEVEIESVVDLSGVDDVMDFLKPGEISGSEVIEVEDLEIEKGADGFVQGFNVNTADDAPGEEENTEEIKVDDLVVDDDEEEEEIDIKDVDFEEENSEEVMHIPDDNDEIDIMAETDEIPMSATVSIQEGGVEMVEIEDLEFDESQDESGLELDVEDLDVLIIPEDTAMDINDKFPDMIQVEETTDEMDEELNIDILDEPFEFGKPDDEDQEEEVSLDHEEAFISEQNQDDQATLDVEKDPGSELDFNIPNDEVMDETEPRESREEMQVDSQIGIELDESADLPVDDEIKLTPSSNLETESDQEVEDDLVDSMGMTIETNFKALEEPVEAEEIKEIEERKKDLDEQDESQEILNEMEGLDDIEPGESIAETVMLSSDDIESPETTGIIGREPKDEAKGDPEEIDLTGSQMEAGSISSEQLENSIEKVVTKMFSNKIDELLISVIEKTVSTEIEKLKRILEEPDETI